MEIIQKLRHYNFLLKFSILTISSNCILLSSAQVNNNHVKVNGYYRSNGTYVEPHYRTAPNNSNRDNFSTYGNINPYTYEIGDIPRDNKPLYENKININSIDLNQRISNPTSIGSNVRSITESNKNYIFNDYRMVDSYGYYSSDINTTTKNNSLYNHLYKFYGKLSKTTILEIESMLYILNYRVGIIDGKIDDTTISSIYSFQLNNGLVVDGLAGTKTIELMRKQIR